MKPSSFLMLCFWLLASCSSTPPADTPPPDAPVTSGPKTGEEPPRTSSGGTTSKLLGRPVRAQTARPLNIQTQCRFQNETGYNGDAHVEVSNGQVRKLKASFNVPQQGRCDFNMEGMKQTRSMPSVEMRDASSGCTVRMWEQGSKAAVSFSSCAKHCSGGETFKYVWPILIDQRTGRCD